MKIKLFPILIGILTLTSCLSLSMDIHLKQNGSGRITMEYGIPQGAENLGRLDGNRNWPIIPIGRADFERSIARINGLKLVSYSSKESGNEYIIKATLDFDRIEALNSFLDPFSTLASWDINGRSGWDPAAGIDLIINEKIDSDINQDLLDLLRQVSENKKVNISLTKDGSNPSLTVIDGAGNPIPAPQQAQITQSGRKAGFSIETAAIFDHKDGLGLRISW